MKKVTTIFADHFTEFNNLIALKIQDLQHQGFYLVTDNPMLCVEDEQYMEYSTILVFSDDAKHKTSRKKVLCFAATNLGELELQISNSVNEMDKLGCELITTNPVYTFGYASHFRTYYLLLVFVQKEK